VYERPRQQRPAGESSLEIEGSFICPYCLQLNTILIDVSAGEHQEMIEDCQVCCRPVTLKIDVHRNSQEAIVAAEIP
jgi:hypothetical protein